MWGFREYEQSLKGGWAELDQVPPGDSVRKKILEPNPIRWERGELSSGTGRAQPGVCTVFLQ